MFGRPVGTLAVDVAPRRRAVDGGQPRLARGRRPRCQRRRCFGQLAAAGLWDQRIRGYRQLDYRVQGLRLRTAQGGEFNIDELSMVADPAGYRVQVRGLRVSGGTAPANEGDPDTSRASRSANCAMRASGRVGAWVGLCQPRPRL